MIGTNQAIDAAGAEFTLLDKEGACRFFGGANSPLDPATLYRGIKSGKYPKPIKIGPGTSRWLLSECEQALGKIIAASRCEDTSK
jgi:hypothetical protein